MMTICYDNTVLVSNTLWHSHGCRFVNWIDQNVSDECYKIKFLNDEVYGKAPVRFIFKDLEHFVEFKIKIFDDEFFSKMVRQ